MGATTIEIGRMLGAYRIEGLLARGSTGEVYRARHTTLDREAALKLLSPDGDAEGLERFEREAKAAGAVHDAHVAQVFDYGSEDGLHCAGRSSTS